MSTSWQQRILDLELLGLTLTEIGERVGLAKSTISELKSGASKAPTGDAAVGLWRLHRRLCRASKGKRASNAAPSPQEGKVA